MTLASLPPWLPVALAIFVLAGLVKRIDKSIDGRSLTTPADFAGALEEWAA